VRVDPFALHAEDAGELGGVEVARARLRAALGNDRRHALSDCLDVGWVKRHG
jgi:hypothetical protein